MKSIVRPFMSLAVLGALLVVPALALGEPTGKTKGKAPKPAPATSAAPAPSAEAPTGFEKKARDIVGAKADGWMPAALAGLKRGMSPEDIAKKGFFGAGDISQYGFADVTLEKGKPGLKSIQLYYQKGKADEWRLASATIRFDSSFEFSDILAVCVKKYGKAKADEVSQQLVTWVGPKFTVVQLSKSIEDGASYELSVTL